MAEEANGQLAKAYVPAEFEHDIYERWLAADVFAPDGAGSTGGLDPRAVRDHPAAAQRHRQPPPRPRPAHHRGGPDGPPRPDARPAGAVPARPRPRQHRRPVRPGRDPRRRRARAAPRSAGSATWSGWTASSTRRRHVILTQQRRVGGSCDWGRLRFTMDEVSSRAVREAFLRLYRKDLAYRAEALINWCPGCRTSVSDLEVIPTPGDGLDLARPLPPASTRRRAPRTRTRPITVATTRPETILGDTAVAVHPDDPRYAALVGRHGAHPVRGAGRADHRGPGGGPGLRHRRRQDHARPTTTTTTRPAAATAWRCPRSSTTPRTSRTPARAYDGLERYDGRHADPRGPGRARRPRGRAAPRDGHRALPAQHRRRGAAPQDAVVHPDRRRWPRPPSRRPAPGRTRILPERFEKTWEHWLANIRDWNVSPPALVGPPDPGLVLPGRPRHRVARRSPVRPPARSAAGRPRSSPRTRTSSTPGSARACGRSPRSAGRTPPRTSPGSTRAR